MTRRIGSAQFVFTDPVAPVEEDGVTRELRMRVALTTVGDKQIELIQPLPCDVEIYTRGIDFATDLVFHHVGIAVLGPREDWAVLEETLAADGTGFNVQLRPEPGSVPVARFGYVDTRSWCGHYTEYLWWGDMLDDSATFPARRSFASQQA